MGSIEGVGRFLRHPRNRETYSGKATSKYRGKAARTDLIAHLRDIASQAGCNRK